MILRHARLAAELAAPLAEALGRLLPPCARVLELGSGTGELGVHVAGRLPGLTWQPSDPDPASRDSAAEWAARAGTANVLPPLALDLFAPAWRLQPCDAVVAVNVLHAAGRGAAEALLTGASAALPRGGSLVVVGLASAPLDAPFATLRAGAAELGFAVLEDAPLAAGCRLLALKRG